MASFAVSANQNYTFDCQAITTVAATTTSTHWNISVPASPTKFNAIIQEYTTVGAGASDFIGLCTGTTASCSQTTSGSGVIAGMPNFVNGRLINGANAGVINVTFRTEVNAAAVTLVTGSYCVMYNE